MSIQVSVIIPAHNVKKTLGTVVGQIINELNNSTKNYELIIAEDGSTDGTYELAKSLAKKNKRVKLLHFERRLGKGGALKNAFLKAEGQAIIFIDADYIDVPKSLQSMINSLKKYDIVTGSRYHKLSKTKRIFKRMIASKIYINLVKLFLFLPFSDIHCGFKGMNKYVVPLWRQIKSTDYFWDTEFLVKASRLGYKICEIPITWDEKKSKYSADLIKDSFKFIKSLIKLRFGLL